MLPGQAALCCAALAGHSQPPTPATKCAHDHPLAPVHTTQRPAFLTQQRLQRGVSGSLRRWLSGRNDGGGSGAAGRGGELQRLAGRIVQQEVVGGEEAEGLQQVAVVLPARSERGKRREAGASGGLWLGQRTSNWEGRQQSRGEELLGKR